ncbi:alpha/beta fold hydrolase [Plantactinospora sp. WMMB334]|uniref:thioesterase domain-containing protein n=1 Tax=Plantactinospora sp. WMMB334 TaxID=3404119 RepID=UPI003B94CCCD
MLSDILVPLGADGDGAPVYCVHSASGSCHTYLPLATMLDHRPLIGIEAPGYDDGEVLSGGLAALADAYARVVDVHRKDRPVHLLGWSMGGVLALEMAARLRSTGCPVPLVVLIDAWVPTGEPTPPDPALRARFVAGFAADTLGGVADRTAEILRVCAEEGTGEEAWDRLRAHGWLPDELDSETLDQRFAVFRNNVRALNEHRVQPGHPGPAMVIRGQHSPPETLPWADLIDDVREVTLPGDHYSLWHDAGPTRLATVIGDALRQTSTAALRGPW